MEQLNRARSQTSLEKLSFSQTAAAIAQESDRLTELWLTGNRQPSEQLSAFTYTLAQTFLTTLAKHAEDTWYLMNLDGQVTTYHLHFGGRPDLILLLSIPEREVAVQLRGLTLSLVEQLPWDSTGSIHGFLETFAAALANPDYSPEAAVPLARRFGTRLTRPWREEIRRLLSDPAQTVLPVPQPRELH